MIEINCDKSKWGPGPWQNEPDRIEFEYNRFPCLMQRNMQLGNWCGYVAVPPGHPAFEKSYNDIEVNVHGGLTYANHCNGHICHIPKPGKPDNVWWLGFDLGHLDDLMPWFKRHGIMNDGVYRDVAYVKAECKNLAQQLEAMV
ncbi:MAG TPA: hypothetical protein VF974_08050 [Patescibacteria group bacterium]